MSEPKATKSSAKPKTAGAAAFTATAKEALDAMETAGRETIEATTKVGQESFAEAFDKATAYGMGGIEKSNEAYETLIAEGKKTIEAMTAASAAVVGGMTACNAKAVDSLKSGLSFNLSYFEKLSAIEAPQEAAAIHVKAFAEAVDLATAKSLEYGKILTESYGKAYVPLKKRFDESISTLAKSFA